ncbi:MAG: Protein kinase domain protein, partial [Acidobacteria bacterium]|nr:Protein kinase domain protein [Acidobacteriota bacterium]
TLQGGPVGLQGMLRLMRPVCDAVDSAHRAGVVHRDLKPENIVVITEHDGEPGPRVLDFGLAKMSGPLGEEEVTIPQSDQTVGIVGTLMYLAPEVLSGKEADARSDQYSLGLIIYELLAGRHPFGSLTDLASIVKAQTTEVPRPLHPSTAGVPPHLSDAIARALSKEAHERFPSVAELMAALG